MVILLYVAATLPYQVAFHERTTKTWRILSFIVDFSFLLDIILTFLTAVPDYEKKSLIVDKKVIAKKYLKSWFIVDVISIMPFDLLFESKNGYLYNLGKFSRFARFTKMLRLLRIVKMTKLVKLFKERAKIRHAADSLLKVDPATLRLWMFLLLIAFVTHLLGCVWVMIAKTNSERNWVRKYTGESYEDISNGDLYIMAFYFAATTLTTVGYGDISADNRVERFFGIIMLFGGVIVYAYAAGSLSSLITNYDLMQEGKQRKLQTLELLNKQYNLSVKLLKDIEWNIDFEYSQRVEGLGHFMESMPLHLKEQLANELHQGVLQNFIFLQDARVERSFTIWLGHRLIPRLYFKGQRIYNEGETISGIFFIKTG